MRRKQGGQQSRGTARASARVLTRDGFVCCDAREEVEGTRKIADFEEAAAGRYSAHGEAWTRTRCRRGAMEGWHVIGDVMMSLMMVKHSSPCPS